MEILGIGIVAILGSSYFIWYGVHKILSNHKINMKTQRQELQELKDILNN